MSKPYSFLPAWGHRIDPKVDGIRGSHRARQSPTTSNRSLPGERLAPRQRRKLAAREARGARAIPDALQKVLGLQR